MIQTSTYLDTFFWVMLCFFTLTSTVIMLMTLVNVLRLKNIRLTWRGGKLGGYPLFSTLFLAFLVGLSFVAVDKADTASIKILVSYFVLGSTWFCTSFFMSKCYITDHGIVKNINDTSQTLAWHQVRDFVEYEKEGKTIFVFFYMVDNKNVENRSIVRLDITIPYNKLRSFRRIVTYKLGRRFDYFHAQDSEITKEYP